MSVQTNILTNIQPDIQTGLYVHIPFCASKCDYCDFLSFVGDNRNWANYQTTLLYEIQNCHIVAPSDNFGTFVKINKINNLDRINKIDTIYIGGGTPTVWPTLYLLQILQALNASFLIEPGAEITCEANPGTLTSEELFSLQEAGINRLSLGLQAWQSHLLTALGRETTRDAFVENFCQARMAGFKNISVDVMFALPGQTLEDWKETLHEVVALNPEHISAYALTLEENTPLWKRFAFDDGNNEEELEKIDREMYAYCKTFLQACGYHQYEISNFCKPGFESRHNTGYWKRKPYLSFGLGAHSFFNGQRWNNTSDMETYLEMPATGNMKKIRQNIEEITVYDAMAETMFLGLRLTKGVSIEEFATQFGVTLMEVYGVWITQMFAEGLLHEKNGHIQLTDLGMDLANRAMAGFLEPAQI